VAVVVNVVVVGDFTSLLGLRTGDGRHFGLVLGWWFAFAWLLVG
tara:strand:- start:32 stop:163 length:132 start_codon:yes stop_codon:yes gene_type:complete